MAKQKEGSLQERVQELIEKRGGYCKKNWGNMTTEPGIADITACYKGLYIVFECKVDNNEPSRHQGIHCRLVRKANGLTTVVWSTAEVKEILDAIDLIVGNKTIDFISRVNELLALKGIDDGTEY